MRVLLAQIRAPHHRAELVQHHRPASVCALVTEAEAEILGQSGSDVVEWNQPLQECLPSAGHGANRI